MAKDTKTFQAYNPKSNTWEDLKLKNKKETRMACYARYKAKGFAIRVLHDSGSYFTIANAKKLPKTVDAKFSVKTLQKQAESKTKTKTKTKAEAAPTMAEAMEFYIANHS